MIRYGSEAVKFHYDPQGRLRQSDVNGLKTHFSYVGHELSAEYDDNGALLRRYIHGPGIDNPLVQYDINSNKTWLYADHEGSIIAAADSNGTATDIYTFAVVEVPGGVASGGFFDALPVRVVAVFADEVAVYFDSNEAFAVVVDIFSIGNLLDLNG